jgi:hypothetical protein
MNGKIWDISMNNNEKRQIKTDSTVFFLNFNESANKRTVAIKSYV